MSTFNIDEYLVEEEKKERERQVRLWEEVEYMYEMGLYNPDEGAGDR